MIAVHFAPSEWGTVADWVAAIGTTGALLVSAFLLSIEIRARRDRVADERRRQASQVSALIEYAPIMTSALGSEGDDWQIQVHNSSSEPIYSCVVYVPTADEFPIEVVFGTIPGNDKRSDRLHPNTAEHLRDLPFPGPVVEVGFVDSRGHGWRRDCFGELKEALPPRIC